MTHRRIVVVGASLAGLRVVEALRGLGYDGGLTLVGEESHPPYDRPPLSKQVLQGVWEPEQTRFRRKDGYDGLGLEMRLGVRATGLDVGGQHVQLDDGTAIPFDCLVVATGARVRTLPGTAPRPGLHVLRGLDDALAIRHSMEGATKVAIVGAGFIGLEVAASCRARGLDVVAIEAMPAPLTPNVGPALCEMVAGVHRDHGVDLRTGVTVTGLLGDERANGLALSDGSRVEADFVVVGIGVVPNTEWLQGSGLTIDNGLVCDAAGAASERVFAAGDVARIPNAWLGGNPRIEHWTNAVEQAAHVAGNILADAGARRAFTSVPYFWSDQYDMKIQFLGRAHKDDEVVVVDGALADRRVTALYRRGDRVVACLAINQPRSIVKYRKLLASGAPWADVIAH